MQIGQHIIGSGAPVYVIAEASANHCRDFERAAGLVIAAAKAGANAVKFQSFTADELAVDIPIVTGYDAQHDVWMRNLGVTTLHQLYALGGLPRPWHEELKHIAEDCGIHFLSTPFSVDAAKFLVEEIGVPAIKIASGDLTFTPLLEYAASTGLPLLVSTGMATLAEVQHAVSGPLDPAYLGQRLCILHCTSSYPLRQKDANLRAITTVAVAFPYCVIGYSDHTTDCLIIPALAVSQGACVIEKHFMLERTLESPDAGHSLDPFAFARMVEVIRAVPQWLGDGVKQPQASELHERLWTRRGKDGKRPTEDARAGRWA